MPAIAPCLTGVKIGEMVLQVRGSGQRGREVRIRAAKCVIGSGPQCTLRLVAPGVQPLHCVIARGPKSAVVRRMAADTLLNGRAFAEASLGPGDRLTIGQVELEVVQVGLPATEVDARRDVPRSAPETPCRTPSAVAKPQLPAAPQGPPPAAVPADNAEEMARRLRVANDQGRARAKRLIAELRTARQEIARLRDQADAQSHDSDALSIEQGKLAQARQDGDAPASDQPQHADWEVRHAETEERISRRQRELDTREAKLEAQRQALEDDRRHWDTEEQKRRRTLDDRSELLDAREAQIDRQEARERPGEPPSSDAPTDELTPAAAVPEDRLQRHTRRPEPRSHSSAEEVLRRLGMMPDLAEDGEGVGPRDTAAPAPSRPTPSEDAGPQSPSTGHDDESIDSYMERLLARVRGAAGEAQAPPRRLAEAERERRESGARPSEPPDGDETASPQHVQPGRTHLGGPRKRGLVEMSPRAVAPERTVNLSAMRDLANQSASSALERHHRHKAASKVRAKFVVTAFSLAAGCGMLWLWAVRPGVTAALYAASACLAVAGLWGVQYLTLAARVLVRRLGSHGLQDPSEPGEDAEV